MPNSAVCLTEAIGRFGIKPPGGTMCRRCNDCTSCGSSQLSGPELTSPVLRAAQWQQTPERRVVGVSAGPTRVPTQRMIVGGDVLGYEQLFSELDGEGRPTVYRNPGTFGTLYQVGRR